MDPDPANIGLQLVLILCLTMINAFFAAAELAVVSVNKNRVKLLAEEGNKKAKLLEKLLEEPTNFLSTIQVAITLAGFFSSASAATGIAEYAGAWLAGFGVPYALQISVIVITVILSYFTLVFGELVPKRIALQKAEAMALFCVRPILAIQKVAMPFVKLLSVSTKLVLVPFHMNQEDMAEKVSKEEIKALVESSDSEFTETETEMISSLIEFDDSIAEEVMTPRTEVYMINIETPLTDYLDQLLEERYSRIPVYEGDSDNIIGILYMKDFIIEARKYGFEQVDIRGILHAPYFVPERKNTGELFRELQANKKHMAVLIDEYGGFTGIVTIEDLIEEVMGDIDDEYDEDEPDIRALDTSTYLVRGSVSIADLNDELDLSLDEETDDYDTLAGFMINLLGYIPKDGEQPTAEFENLLLKAEQVGDKRIEMIKICILPAEENEEQEHAQ